MKLQRTNFARTASVAAIMIGMLALSACAGRRIAYPHSDDTLGIDFPCAPGQPDPSAPPVLPSWHSVELCRLDDGPWYIAAYTDLGSQLDSESLPEHERQELLLVLAGGSFKEQPRQVQSGEVQGLEVVRARALPSPGTSRERYFLAGNRVYVIIVLADSGDRLFDRAAEAFFSSVSFRRPEELTHH